MFAPVFPSRCRFSLIGRKDLQQIALYRQAYIALQHMSLHQSCKMFYGQRNVGRNSGLLIVDHYSHRGRIKRFPTTLIGCIVAVILCVSLSTWYVMTQYAEPDYNPIRTYTQPIGMRVDSLVVTPTALRPVSTQKAEELNASIPVSTTPNPAASAMYVPLGDGNSWLRSLDCLTAAVYYEAASEGLEGQRAVAQVVLNRTRHPAFPHSVCGVVFEGSERKTGCQFTFTCDGSLMRIPGRQGWAQARSVANAALAGYVYQPVGWSTHYHTGYVAPYWAPTLTKTALVGAHIFYRWPGGEGRPSAFTARYAGIEPLIDRAGGFPGGSKLLGLPSFVGMVDPDTPDAATGPRMVEPVVLPFTGARPNVAATHPPSSTAPMPLGTGKLSANRWVIGVKPVDDEASAAGRSGKPPSNLDEQAVTTSRSAKREGKSL